MRPVRLYIPGRLIAESICISKYRYVLARRDSCPQIDEEQQHFSLEEHANVFLRE